MIGSRVLTPDELLFQSFHHSQGDDRVQLAIFDYMDAAYDLRPSTEVSDTQMKRYLGYLSGKNPNTHLKISAGDTDSVTGTVEPLFDEDRDDNLLRTTNSILAVKAFTVRLLIAENALFAEDSSWIKPQNDVMGKAERLRHRIVSGRASFLHLYGRDRNSTGFKEFNDLYQQSWAVITKAVDSNYAPKTKALVANHTYCIAKINAAYQVSDA